MLNQLALSEDPLWMQRALEQASAASTGAEVPVGAVLIAGGGSLLAEAHNLTRTTGDPTDHAELVVLRRVAARFGGSALLGSTLYVTLEPCGMCAGALVLARIARLVYAAPDPKSGMCGSLGNLVEDRRLNHRVAVTAGVLAEPAARLLRAFFQARREARVDLPASRS